MADLGADGADGAAAAAGPELMDARSSLAIWLATGRGARGMTLDQVARVTKIQVRTLERIESGSAEGLPADVFVRGFVRSFAKCVGLDEADAVRRYQLVAAASGGVVALSTSSSVSAPVVLHGMASRTRASTGVPTMHGARAVVAAMADLAPVTARASSQFGAVQLPEALPLPDVIAAPEATSSKASDALVADSIEPAPAVIEADPDAAVTGVVATATEAGTSKKKRGGRRSTKARLKRDSLAMGTPSSPTPIVIDTAVARAVDDRLVALAVSPLARPVYRPDPVVETFVEIVVASVEAHAEPSDAPDAPDASAAGEPGEISELPLTSPWQPTMPPLATTSVPWRSNRPLAPRVSTVRRPVVPSLVIDDADPDSAEREREDRVVAHTEVRRSFLPPILLDREDRAARQGGLTLAVIILLIAATLTLSYLMRRPSSTGDGITRADPLEQLAAHVPA